ncbi:MAG: DNA-formamidopyrimidine glycosylase [Acholeplasma sp.]|nr:DNA-formamidopyrimidine glycosylase [Acholeplasma sp.]
MPELPEVEVVRTQLEKVVLNKQIIGFDVYYPDIFNGDINRLREVLIGNEVIRMERYGKYLVFIFKNDDVLISHLRMEGKYLVRRIEDEKHLSRHDHLVFKFDDGMELWYHDTRKFGRMDLRKIDDYLLTKPLNALGNEPKNMQEGELYRKIYKKNVPIKVALLDQSNIAGLGNIYVDETLFLSNIHPERKANTITKEEADFITLNAVKVLDKALKLGGTTIRTFAAGDIHGRFQNELLVHTKANMPCPVCNTIIKKIIVGGRGTYFCEKCQK